MYGGIGRIIAVLGTLVALAGFGLFMWVIIAPMAELVVGPDAGTPANPFTREVFGLPAVAVGFGGFLAGGVIASVGAGMARAARRRHDRAQRRARGWY